MQQLSNLFLWKRNIFWKKSVTITRKPRFHSYFAETFVSNHFTENSSMRSKMKAVKFTTNELIKSDLKNRTFLSDKNRSKTINFLVHPSQLLGANHE